MKFAALFLTLPLLLLAPAGDDLDVVRLNGVDCPLEGTAKNEEVKALNRDKGRYHTPVASDIDTTVTLTSMIAPGDDETRFDAKSAATVIGYVLEVNVGGNETCNCKATDPNERDTHIALTISQQASSVDAKKQSVVAEVSPRTRLIHQKQSGANDWTTDQLKQNIKGKWVKITGWLLFDIAHVHQAENTNPGNATNWRATCWEIHPVTSIEVLSGPPPGDFQLDPMAVNQFQKSHAAHVDSIKGRREAITSRNTKLRQRLGEESDDDNH